MDFINAKIVTTRPMQNGAMRVTLDVTAVEWSQFVRSFISEDGKRIGVCAGYAGDVEVARPTPKPKQPALPLFEEASAPVTHPLLAANSTPEAKEHISAHVQRVHEDAIAAAALTGRAMVEITIRDDAAMTPLPEVDEDDVGEMPAALRRTEAQPGGPFAALAQNLGGASGRE